MLRTRFVFYEDKIQANVDKNDKFTETAKVIELKQDYMFVHEDEIYVRLNWLMRQPRNYLP